MTFTVADIQNRFGVTQNTVLGWIAAGELRAINVGREPGKIKPRWRITEDALRDFEILRTATPPMPKVRRRRQVDEIEYVK